MLNRTTLHMLALILTVLLQSSCIAVGYTSGRGWAVWPGGLGILLMLGLAALFMFSSMFRR
jgi:hypothetical protein